MLKLGDKVRIKTKDEIITYPNMHFVKKKNGESEILETVHYLSNEIILVRVGHHEMERLGTQATVISHHPDAGYTVQFLDGRTMSWITEDMMELML